MPVLSESRAILPGVALRITRPHSKLQGAAKPYRTTEKTPPSVGETTALLLAGCLRHDGSGPPDRHKRHILAVHQPNDATSFGRVSQCACGYRSRRDHVGISHRRCPRGSAMVRPETCLSACDPASRLGGISPARGSDPFFVGPRGGLPAVWQG